ncbi:MAG: aldo/keto reductase, partial [Clostridia bacterium]|nr:aldo/keto reductase [Clostridia bacterium]
MQYRKLGKTGLMVSEVGFGGEWLERHETADSVELVKYAHRQGVNIIDCWMPDPKSRDIIGQAISQDRAGWIVQGHIGSTYQGGQYTRTRDVEQCRIAFEDLLHRLQTDYVDLGMIHYVDLESDWETVSHPGPYLDYAMELKAEGKIRHIGLSTHNPVIARKAAESGLPEMILFSVNPAFDLMPPTDDLMNYFAEQYEDRLNGVDPVRTEMYKVCEQNNVGITCMKPFAGGRLFDAKRSPFGVALTPVQCIHYCLTKPGVASVLCGYDTAEQLDAAVAYETAGDAEKDYASVLASAPKHTFAGGECTYCGHCKPCPAEIDITMVNKLYDLAVMQPGLPESLREHYRALEHHAGECISCRGCESRCPFGVSVADRMIKT